MPLVKTQLFLTLLPAVQKAAEQAMTLYNRGLDPLDKEKDIEIGTLPFPKIKVSVDCSRTSSPLLNTSNPSDLTVDPDKVAELFGVAFAYNMVPVLINEFTDYFKDATITIPPGQPVNTVGTAAAQTGSTTGNSPAAIII